MPDEGAAERRPLSLAYHIPRQFATCRASRRAAPFDILAGMETLSRLGCLYSIRQTKSPRSRFGHIEHVTLAWPAHRPPLSWSRRNQAAAHAARRRELSCAPRRSLPNIDLAAGRGFTGPFQFLLDASAGFRRFICAMFWGCQKSRVHLISFDSQ